MSFSMKIVEDDLTPMLNYMRGVLRTGLIDDLMDIAQEIVELAKQFCPVDTGFLQSSIYAQMTGRRLEVELGAYAPYAWFVEAGTCHMGAQPFIRPAILAYEDTICMRLLRAIFEGI